MIKNFWKDKRNVYLCTQTNETTDMNTTAIHVDTELYKKAEAYASRHNASIDKMVERYISTLILTPVSPNKLKRPTVFSGELLKLVGVAKHTTVPDDTNDDEAKWEYLKKKYDL